MSILEYLQQPDGYTCQSAAIGKLIGSSNVNQIRADLEAIGTPGDPAVMGSYLEPRVKAYEFTSNGSLNGAKEKLNQGWQIITHGWFTGSGHVINVTGYGSAKNGRVTFHVDDPWAEFQARGWHYNFNKSGNNVHYSAHLMYAACIASHSVDDAAAIYRSGKLDSAEKGGWFHYVRN